MDSVDNFRLHDDDGVVAKKRERKQENTLFDEDSGNLVSTKFLGLYHIDYDSKYLVYVSSALWDSVKSCRGHRYLEFIVLRLLSYFCTALHRLADRANAS